MLLADHANTDGLKQFLDIIILLSHFAGNAIDLHVYMRLTSEICITNVKEERKKRMSKFDTPQFRIFRFLAITIPGIYNIAS